MHIADNHEALLDYLYEEGDPAERLKIAQHLQQCASCSVAVLEFQRVRGLLSSWKPPAAELGFRLVQDRDVSRGARAAEEMSHGWFGWAPGGESGWSGLGRWAQVAAAVLLFAAGMAVSQLHVNYNNGSLTLSIGDGPARRDGSIVLPAAATALRDDIERAVREQLATSNGASVDTEQLLQRVRAMLDQSEQRQQRELALRLSQVTREVDTQHQADLLRIQQNFGQTQDLMEQYLVKTSGGVK